MDLLGDDMGRLLIFYYTILGLLRTDIEFSLLATTAVCEKTWNAELASKYKVTHLRSI